MRRLEPTLTAIVASLAMVLAGTGTATAQVDGDCLACVGRAVRESGQAVAAGQGPWLEACIKGRGRSCPVADFVSTPVAARLAVDNLIGEIEGSCGDLAACLPGFCGDDAGCI